MRANFDYFSCMEFKISVPQILVNITEGKKRIKASGKTIHEVLVNIDERYPGFVDAILEHNGAVKHHIFICVNEENIRYLNGLETSLSKDDEVSIVAAIAGGIT